MIQKVVRGIDQQEVKDVTCNFVVVIGTLVFSSPRQKICELHIGCLVLTFVKGKQIIQFYKIC